MLAHHGFVLHFLQPRLFPRLFYSTQRNRESGRAVDFRAPINLDRRLNRQGWPIKTRVLRLLIRVLLLPIKSGVALVLEALRLKAKLSVGLCHE